MMRLAVGALLLSSPLLFGGLIAPAAAQGVYIGPGGVGVDAGPRYRDDRDYDRERYRDRERFRGRDRYDDERARRRRHRDEYYDR